MNALDDSKSDSEDENKLNSSNKKKTEDRITKIRRKKEILDEVGILHFDIKS